MNTSAHQHRIGAPISTSTHQIAIFASGSGSNAQCIIEYFQGHPTIRVALVLTNNPQAGVLERAKKLGAPSLVFTRTELYQSDTVLQQLRDAQVSFIVLAGFLWLMPSNLVEAFPDRIVNIHPALLPKFGGKGMYGMRVHEAVVQAGEKESGITVHLVDNRYDEGQVIFQAACSLSPSDTPEIVSRKVQQLEHRHFPRVIEQFLLAEPITGNGA